MRTIELLNVGPIQRLDIPIPEGGGVVVLRGRNGTGKTTALDAVSAMLEGDGAIAARDGEERGSVRGLGCEVLVRKRTSHAGTLEVHRIQGEDPGQLVDPGIVDPVAADRARIRALCRLARVTPSRALFAEVEKVAGTPLPITLSEDLAESASKTKRAIQAKARDAEDQANVASGRLQALLSASREAPLDGPCDAPALAQALDDATRALARAEGEADGRGQALKAAQVAREALDAALAGYSGPSVQDAQAKLSEAESAEEAAREALTRAQQAKASARADVLRAREFAATCESWQASIAAAEGLSEFAPEELDELRERVRQAREAEARGRDIRKAREQRAEAEQVLKEVDTLRAQAERLREAADACDQVVSAAIAEVAPRGLGVSDGRLTFEHPTRGKVPFAELSHGERWSVAMDVGIDAVGPNGLLAIAQEAWEGLDGEHRSAVAAHARRRKAVVLTAEATMDDLGAEVL